MNIILHSKDEAERERERDDDTTVMWKETYNHINIKKGDKNNEQFLCYKYQLMI